MNTQANPTAARIDVWVVTLAFSFRELEFNFLTSLHKLPNFLPSLSEQVVLHFSDKA